MIGGRIKLARETVGLTQAELAEKIGTTQSGVASMEANLYRPSPEYVATIAKETGFGLPFFRPSELEEFPTGALLYRARAALSKRERQHAHGLTTVAYELAAHLAQGLRPLPVNLPRLKEPPAKAAQIVRAALGFGPEAPLSDLLHKLERNGVLVLAIPQELDTLDGFAVWVGSPYPRPVIALMGGKAGYRINFTLGEELGHLVLHSPLTIPVVEAEQQAREFCRELLMPAEAIAAEMPLPVTLSGLAPLKVRWRVSLQLLIRRALDLGLVTQNQYRYLNQQVRVAGWARAEPGDEQIVQPQPRLMRKMAELRYGSPVDLPKLSADTGVPSGTLAAILQLPQTPARARVIPFRARGGE